jgi:type I restriction enzyme, R subunit
VTETVRALFPDATELRSRWANRIGRHDVIQALQAHGIDPAELLERSSLGEADPIDVLVHLAWNQPLATRTDRVRRVHKEYAEFFETYQPAARQVLDYLLDKYAEHGIEQLDDLGVLQVQPLASLGSPAEIAARFGSINALKDAVAKLSELIYVA